MHIIPAQQVQSLEREYAAALANAAIYAANTKGRGDALALAKREANLAGLTARAEQVDKELQAARATFPECRKSST